MLALGLILILLAAGAIVAALFGASAETSTFDLGVFTVEMNTLGVFLTGAVTVLLLATGIWLVRSGVRRANRRRHEKKELDRLKRQDATAPSGRATGSPTADGSTTASSEGSATRDATHDTGPSTGTGSPRS